MARKFHLMKHAFILLALSMATVCCPALAEGFRYSDEFEFLKEKYRGNAFPFCRAEEHLQQAKDSVSQYFITNKNGGNVQPHSFGIPSPFGSSYFFNNHCFYWVTLVDWEDDKNYDYLTAVNLETGQGIVYYVGHFDRTYTKKRLRASSNILTAYELDIDALNRAIESDNIVIDDLNLRAYVKYVIDELMFFYARGFEIFDRNSFFCRPDPHLNEEVDPNTFSGQDTIERRELRACLAPYCLGSGMTVYKLDGGAYAVRLITWAEVMGYISEWDFTVERNGTVHIHEIRDIAWRIGPYVELKDEKDK